MENFNFSWFTKTKSRLSDPRISISKNNSFGLNAALVRKYGLKEFPYLLLGYDKNKNAIGFRFMKEKGTGALSIRFTESDSGTTNSKNFFLDNKLDAAKFHGRHVVSEVVVESSEIILAVNLQK